MFINKLIALKTPKKLVEAPSFFDYSAKEKKKILSSAARRANEAQLALVKEYDSRYGI